MTKSPGHKKWPDHQIKEEKVAEKLEVRLNNNVLGVSEDVIKVSEDNHPLRYYFPRSNLNMELFEESNSTSQCPFKGKANYFNVLTPNKTYKDAAWSYEEPFEEHQDLKNRIAFYDHEMDELTLTEVEAPSSKEAS